MTDSRLHLAYTHCLEMTRNHYENFPVASRLLPRKMRVPVSVIYAFARTADDFADEGDLTTRQRLDSLEHYGHELAKIGSGEDSDDPVFIALGDVIHQFHLPLSLFHDLLQAFKIDVRQTRYQTFTELLDYCRLSANPVGRILLYLHSGEVAEPGYSDAICTGLQLINFYQDIAQDYDENRRIYIPLEDLLYFQVTENDIAHKINNDNTRALMDFQLNRANKLYLQGQPLCRALSGRFGFELRMIYAGGRRILHKLQQNTVNIYARPRLTYRDKITIVRDAIFNR